MDGETNPLKPTILSGHRRISFTIRENWLATLSGKGPEDGEE